MPILHYPPPVQQNASAPPPDPDRTPPLIPNTEGYFWVVYVPLIGLAGWAYGAEACLSFALLTVPIHYAAFGWE